MYSQQGMLARQSGLFNPDRYRNCRPLSDQFITNRVFLYSVNGLKYFINHCCPGKFRILLQIIDIDSL
jgi:hypothetical protein